VQTLEVYGKKMYLSRGEREIFEKAWLSRGNKLNDSEMNLGIS